MSDIVYEVLQTIETIADSKVNNLSFDKTVKAEIVELIDFKKGLYKINYEGTPMEAYATDLSYEYKRGDNVFIKVPEGDFSNKKFIENKTYGDKNLDDTDINQLSNYTFPVSPNLVNDNENHELTVFPKNNQCQTYCFECRKNRWNLTSLKEEDHPLTKAFQQYISYGAAIKTGNENNINWEKWRLLDLTEIVPDNKKYYSIYFQLEENGEWFKQDGQLESVDNNIRSIIFSNQIFNNYFIYGDNQWTTVLTDARKVIEAKICYKKENDENSLEWELLFEKTKTGITLLNKQAPAGTSSYWIRFKTEDNGNYFCQSGTIMNSTIHVITPSIINVRDFLENIENQQIFNNTEFEYYSKNYNLLKISADFQTLFQNDLPPETGNYGLKVTFTTTEGEGKDFVKILDINDFNGNEYQFLTPVKQFTFMNVKEKGYLTGIKSIELFQENFQFTEILDNSPKLCYNNDIKYIGENSNNQKIYIPNLNSNIIINNISIEFLDEKNLLENPYYLQISAPEGHTFTVSDTSCFPSELTLSANLFHNGERVIPEQIHWFKEDSSVLQGDEGYNKDAGPYWREITATADTNAATPIATVSNNILKFTPNSSIYKKMYQVIVVYKDMVFKETTSLVNLSKDYKIWIEQRGQKNNLKLVIKAKFNNINQTGLKGKWFSLLPDGSWKLLNKDDYWDKLEHLHQYLNYGTGKFKCQVYEENEPQKYQYLTTIEYIYNEIPDGLITGRYLSAFEGPTSFKYDANGDIGIDKAGQNYEMKFSLQVADGEMDKSEKATTLNELELEWLLNNCLISKIHQTENIVMTLPNSEKNISNITSNKSYCNYSSTERTPNGEAPESFNRDAGNLALTFNYKILNSMDIDEEKKKILNENIECGIEFYFKDKDNPNLLKVETYKFSNISANNNDNSILGHKNILNYAQKYQIDDNKMLISDIKFFAYENGWTKNLINGETLTQEERNNYIEKKYPIDLFLEKNTEGQLILAEEKYTIKKEKINLSITLTNFLGEYQKQSPQLQESMIKDFSIIDSDLLNPNNLLDENPTKTSTLFFKIRPKFQERLRECELTVRVKNTQTSMVEDEYKTNILFTKDGDLGTNGTNYYLKVKPKDIFEDRFLIGANKSFITLKAELYKDGQLQNYDNFEWSYGSQEEEASHLFKIVATNNLSEKIIEFNDKDINFNKIKYNYIKVKALGIEGGASLSTLYPIDIISVNNTDFYNQALNVKIPQSIVYDAAGFNPQYDMDMLDFNGLLHENPDNEYISIVERENQKIFQASPNFDCSNGQMGYIKCSEPSDSSKSVYFTIIKSLNAYSNQAINDWDGTRLKIDENGGQYILAPQIGAGMKNDDKQFSGVVMGKISNSSSMTDAQIMGSIGSQSPSIPLKGKTGLFGYQDGTMSFAFTEDGKAFLGNVKADSGKGGRIYFDGSDGKIISGNYDGKNGMMIDLQTGHIDAYNFKLTSNHLVLEGNSNNSGVLHIDCINDKNQRPILMEVNQKDFYLKSQDYIDQKDISQALMDRNEQQDLQKRDSQKLENIILINNQIIENTNKKNNTETSDEEKKNLQNIIDGLIVDRNKIIINKENPTDTEIKTNLTNLCNSLWVIYDFTKKDKEQRSEPRESEMDYKLYQQSYPYKIKIQQNTIDAVLNDEKQKTGCKIDLRNGIIDIRGTITATSGSIGGWIISDKQLKSANNRIYLDSSNGKIYGAYIDASEIHGGKIYGGDIYGDIDGHFKTIQNMTFSGEPLLSGGSWSRGSIGKMSFGSNWFNFNNASISGLKIKIE